MNLPLLFAVLLLLAACRTYDPSDFCVNQVKLLPLKPEEGDLQGVRCDATTTVTTEILPSGVLVRCMCPRPTRKAPSP